MVCRCEGQGNSTLRPEVQALLDVQISTVALNLQHFNRRMDGGWNSH